MNDSEKKRKGIYVPVFRSVREHDKTYDMAEALGANRAHIVGHLVMFWTWIQENRPDGVLEKLRAPQIAAACLWEGDPKSFVDALLGAGFIRKRGSAWHVPGWREGGGRILEIRRKDAERKRESRKRTTSGGRSDVTSPGGPSLDEKERREDGEKRREGLPPPSFSLESVENPGVGDALLVLAVAAEDDGYKQRKDAKKLHSLADQVAGGRELTQPQFAMAANMAESVAGWWRPTQTPNAMKSNPGTPEQQRVMAAAKLFEVKPVKPVKP